jgi:small subunit ribosomal protein S5
MAKSSSTKKKESHVDKNRRDKKKSKKKERAEEMGEENIDEEYEEDGDDDNSEESQKVVSVPEDLENWKPKTELGKQVKEGKITDIDDILKEGKAILEAEIVDMLLPNLSSELLMVGQAKGKFGGGQRRVFRQTQKKTEEGNKPHFTTIAVVGDDDGHVGIGIGKAKETVPAREKAIRKAKINIMKIRRGCGSWVCHCGEPHSIPFKVTGKCSSLEIDLMPAPKGKGLVVDRELSKILRLVGIKDVWSDVRGQAKNKVNLVEALWDCFRRMSQMRVQQEQAKTIGLVDGSIKAGKAE